MVQNDFGLLYYNGINVGLDFMKALADLAREEDPSRLISAARLVNNTKLRIEGWLAAFIDIIG